MFAIQFDGKWSQYEFTEVQNVCHEFSRFSKSQLISYNYKKMSSINDFSYKAIIAV